MDAKTKAEGRVWPQGPFQLSTATVSFRRMGDGPELPMAEFVRERALVQYLSADGRPPVRGPRDAWHLLRPWLERETVEVCVVLCLDAQHRLISVVEVSRGAINTSIVLPREVFRGAIRSEAASVVLAHNHPSGDPTPSVDDRAVTAQLVAAGRLLEIIVQDHIVVGAGRFVSFAEAGLL